MKTYSTLILARSPECRSDANAIQRASATIDSDVDVAEIDDTFSRISFGSEERPGVETAAPAHDAGMFASAVGRILFAMVLSGDSSLIQRDVEALRTRRIPIVLVLGRLGASLESSLIRIRSEVASLQPSTVLVPSRWLLRKFRHAICEQSVSFKVGGWVPRIEDLPTSRRRTGGSSKVVLADCSYLESSSDASHRLGERADRPIVYVVDATSRAPADGRSRVHKSRVSDSIDSESGVELLTNDLGFAVDMYRRGADVCFDDTRAEISFSGLRWKSVDAESGRLTVDVSSLVGTSSLAHAVAEEFRTRILRKDPSIEASRPNTTARPSRVARPFHDVVKDEDRTLLRALREHVERAGSRPPVRRMLVIGHDLSRLTGVARPILDYGRLVDAHGDAEIDFAEVRSHESVRSAIDESRSYDTVLINSIGVFERITGGTDLLEELDPDRVRIYCHETAYSFDRFLSDSPERFDRFARSAARFRFLCVSEAQKRYLAESLGVGRSDVVYNTILRPSMPPELAIGGVDEVKIVGVGTVQHRKGVSLFSETADTASSVDRPWTFEWIGHSVTETLPTYGSPLVRWRGRLDGQQLWESLASGTVFFLPSFDDPFPLSVLEAMSIGQKIVITDTVGTAEILEGVRGVRIVRSRRSTDTMNAIDEVLAEETDKLELLRRFESVASPARFFSRMNASLVTELG